MFKMPISNFLQRLGYVRNPRSLKNTHMGLPEGESGHTDT